MSNTADRVNKLKIILIEILFKYIYVMT